MRQKPGTAKPSAEAMVKDIRRRTRKRHSAEEKIRIVLEGLRGEDSIAELCRREGIATSLYYSWSRRGRREWSPKPVPDRALTTSRGQRPADRCRLESIVPLHPGRG